MSKPVQHYWVNRYYLVPLTLCGDKATRPQGRPLDTERGTTCRHCITKLEYEPDWDGERYV